MRGPEITDEGNEGSYGQRSATELPLGPRTVVVAGDDAGQRARSLADRAGWPLLAEPSSGARTGPALRTYRLLLDTELAERVERVVVFGHPTLSRPVQRLLSRDGIEVLDADPTWTRPYAVTPITDPVVDGTDDPAWLAAWQEADGSVSRQLDALVDGPASRPTTSPARSAARCRPAATSSWAPRTRSATST